MNDTQGRLVDDYLGRLRRALGDLPHGRREELVEEIREHIDEARAVQPTASEAEMRNLLERIGAPESIAAEERARLGVPTKKMGGLEIAALVLLVIGGWIVPVAGWLGGIVLLWISGAWTRGEKLIGTLLLPGTWAVLVYLPLLAGGGLPAIGPVEAALLAVLFGAGSFVSVFYLVYKLRRRSRAEVNPALSPGSAGEGAVR